MKLVAVGDLTINGKHRKGVFIECNEWAIRDILDRVGMLGDAYVIPGPKDDEATDHTTQVME